MKDYLDTSRLKFSIDYSELKNSKGRTDCPRCGNRRRYYCYDCVIPIDHSPPHPKAQLPVKIHIIRHNSEKISKSSIIPFKMIYPNDVFLYTFTQPDRFNPQETEGTINPPLPPLVPNRTVILFPTEDSVTVKEMDPTLWEGVVDNTNGDRGIQNIIVIDSTWSTAMQVISKSIHLRNVDMHVKLGSQCKTIFWRHQRMGRECLATCEAVYVFLREIFDLSACRDSYDNRYDDVLFYYLHVPSIEPICTVDWSIILS